MSSRSGMAALAIVASAVVGLRADDKPTAGAVENTVYLELQIAGLGPEGCKIDIKPAHPACQFKPVAKTIESHQVREVIRLDAIPIIAKATGADRDCTFAITVKEPNLPAKTFRRGIVLSPPVAGQDVQVKVMKVYLPSPSLAVKEDKDRPRR